jgi:hypothetical protein
VQLNIIQAQKQRNSAICDNMDNFEDIILSENAVTDKYYRFCFYDASKIVKLIKSESGMVVSIGWKVVEIY